MATNKTVKKTIIIDIKGKQAEVSINGVKKSMKDLNVELNNMRQNATGASAATGAASATVLELGRAVSDSNYGIRGMANNLSQLATNFIYTTKQAGTLAGGLKNIGRALMGPLGIILLFQTGIALLERWAMKTDEATEAVDDFNKAVSSAQGGAASNLKILKQALEDNTMSQEDAAEAVRKANEEYVDLNIELDYNNQLTDASVEAIDNKILALERLAKAQAAQKVLEEKFGQILELRIKQMMQEDELARKKASKTSFSAITTTPMLPGAVGVGTSPADMVSQRKVGEYSDISDLEDEIDTTVNGINCLLYTSPSPRD